MTKDEFMSMLNEIKRESKIWVRIRKKTT
jgi:hypothetical protein